MESPQCGDFRIDRLLDWQMTSLSASVPEELVETAWPFLGSIGYQKVSKTAQNQEERTRLHRSIVGMSKNLNCNLNLPQCCNTDYFVRLC